MTRNLVGGDPTCYPSGTAEQQKEANGQSKMWAIKFLEDCQIGFPTKVMPQSWSIHPAAMPLIGDMLNDIRLEAAANQAQRVRYDAKVDRLADLKEKMAMMMDCLEADEGIPIDIN